MSNYAFEHQGKVFTPDGRVEVPLSGEELKAHVKKQNREVEAMEIEWLKTGPEKVMLYVKREEPKDGFTGMWFVQTWLGTFLAYALIGGPRVVGFQSSFNGQSYRRAITCRVFGTLYHGWYMESSGDYCRLKRAKKQ